MKARFGPPGADSRKRCGEDRDEMILLKEKYEAGAVDFQAPPLKSEAA